jgi:hypothetical protein
MEQAVLRAIRACVADHMADDRYAMDDWNPSDEMMYDVCPGTEAPRWLKEWDSIPHTERTKDRLSMLQTDREFKREGRWMPPECRTVEEIFGMGAYEVRGPSIVFDPTHARRDCVLVSITYGRNGKAGADYEVGFKKSHAPRCWAD